MITIDITESDMPSDLTDALTNAMQDILNLTLDRVSSYPPPRPGSPYVRGGPGSQDLGGSWTKQIHFPSGDVVGELGNDTTYGPFVQAEDTQAWMHRGRWTPIEEIVEQSIPDYMRIFEHWLENAGFE